MEDREKIERGEYDLRVIQELRKGIFEKRKKMAHLEDELRQIIERLQGECPHLCVAESISSGAIAPKPRYRVCTLCALEEELAESYKVLGDKDGRNVIPNVHNDAMKAYKKMERPFIVAQS